jgi:hypothetical protein
MEEGYRRNESGYELEDIGRLRDRRKKIEQPRERKREREREREER